MSKEPKTVEITGADGKINITEREIMHPKSKKLTKYLSFSKGMENAGFYITEETKKEIIKFLGGKK